MVLQVDPRGCLLGVVTLEGWEDAQLSGSARTHAVGRAPPADYDDDPSEDEDGEEDEQVVVC